MTLVNAGQGRVQAHAPYQRTPKYRLFRLDLVLHIARRATCFPLDTRARTLVRLLYSMNLG